MPISARIARTKRTRKRRAATFSPSELQWLTGKRQPGANRFWRFRFARDFGALLKLLDRAVGAASEERIAELRALISSGDPMKELRNSPRIVSE